MSYKPVTKKQLMKDYTELQKSTALKIDHLTIDVANLKAANHRLLEANEDLKILIDFREESIDMGSLTPKQKKAIVLKAIELLELFTRFTLKSSRR